MTVYGSTIVVLGVVGGRQVMTTTPSVDPTIAPGVVAPLGSIYLRDDGSLYTKTGAGNTAWGALASATALAAAVAALTASIASSVSAARVPQPLVNPKYGGTNGTVALSTNGARAMFVGYAYRAFVAGEVFATSWRCALSGNTFTFGEIALGKGALVPGSSPSVIPVGFVDVVAQMSAGPANYVTNIPVSAGQSIAVGDGLWIIFAKASTGSPTLAALGTVDDLQAGIQGTNATAGWRPSAQIGVAATFATDAATLGIKSLSVAPFP